MKDKNVFIIVLAVLIILGIVASQSILTNVNETNKKQDIVKNEEIKAIAVQEKSFFKKIINKILRFIHQK